MNRPGGTVVPPILDRCREAAFRTDGFVTVDRLVSDHLLASLRERFDRLFRGEFETGVEPDEVNWQEGSGDPTLTRQICNGWKADRLVASVVLSECLGEVLARLAGTGVVVDDEAEVVDSTLIGPVVVGAGARIVDSTVGPSVAVGEGCRIEASTVVDSVLMDGSAVLGCRRVVASVLGREAQVQGTHMSDRLVDDAEADLSVLLGDHSVVDVAGRVAGGAIRDG